MISKEGKRIGELLDLLFSMKFGGYLIRAYILGSGNFLMEGVMT